MVAATSSNNGKPSLDNLSPVQVRSQCIFACHNHKSRCVVAILLAQVALHGNTASICLLQYVWVRVQIVLIFPSTKKTHRHARSASREGFAIIDSVPDTAASVATRPYACRGADTQVPAVQPTCYIALSTLLYRAILGAVRSYKIVFINITYHTVMIISTSHKAWFERVNPEFLLHSQSFDYTTAHIIVLLSHAATELLHGIGVLKMCKFISRPELAMQLGVALHLHHFNASLEVFTNLSIFKVDRNALIDA
jgi:hypothetical protein